MKLRFKSAALLMLCCVILAVAGNNGVVYATQEKLDETNERIDELEQEQDELEDSLDAYNDDLAAVSNEVVSLEQQIAAKQEEIDTAKSDLEQAQKDVEEQYEAMKVRIRYIYENSSTSYLSLILQARSFSDFLNRAEYIVSIQNYDRNMLENYQQMCVDIEEKKKALEADMSELETLQAESESKQNQLSTLVEETQDSLEESKAELEEQIAKAEEYEAQIEAAKLAEQQAIAAQNAASGSGSTPIENTYVETAGDLELMAAIIYCEAGGESYEGQLAVGSVVMNRVNSSQFPNTISGVIYQSGQFSPVASGKFALVLSSGLYSNCLSAAQEVLNGNITVNFLYFHSAAGWNSDYGTYIGNQVFY